MLTRNGCLLMTPAACLWQRHCRVSQALSPHDFSDTSTIGKVDYTISKNIKAFGRFSYWQASDVGNFGGAANYSVYDNKDRTKTFAGGVDFNEGSFTHSFRAEYLKFVNVISDAVQGSSLPFANVPNEIVISGTGFVTGPSFLAPQSTIQSDKQIKYDGSHVYGSHIIRWGVEFNKITGWTFASFFGLTPQDTSSFLFAPGTLTCPGGQTGSACPLNYTADVVVMGNGEGAFTELPRFGKPDGGLGPDNRLGAYIADSWKVKPNFTLSYGMRYVRDTGRTDSDISLPELNNFIIGAGNAVKQPNTNFAPQAGFAWDPKSNGKTVIRGGVGIFYDNTVFNDILFDRELKLASGAFNATQNACNAGAAGGLGSAGALTFRDGRRYSRWNTGRRKRNLQHANWGHSRGRRRNLRRANLLQLRSGRADCSRSFLCSESHRRERHLPAEQLSSWRTEPFRSRFPRPELQIAAVDSIKPRRTGQCFVLEWYSALIIFETSDCTI